jgi:hypothetical protein
MMSTRGNYGFKKNGISKITYCHFDSYPAGLGKDLIELLKTTSIEKLNEVFDNLELVEEDIPPTKEQREHIKKWFDVPDNEWYSVMRNAQGKPVFQAFIEGMKYMVDLPDGGSYEYIIDLDTNELIINEGNYGRFSLDRLPEFVENK